MCSCYIMADNPDEDPMAQLAHDWNRLAWWHWAAPLVGLALVAAKTLGLVAPDGAVFIAPAVVALGGAVFAAVHHAEVLAARVGEPFGSILLALAITTIEVGLIIALMISGAPGSDTVARDTVFSVVMIVLNGIVGLCLVVGAAHHYEQEFRVQGASAILSVIATLAIVAFVFPNVTRTTSGPTFASSQLLFVDIVSLALYALFVYVQTFRHRADFVSDDGVIAQAAPPTARRSLISATLLTVSLMAVILLAKALSPIVGAAVAGAGLPPTVVGVVIAMVVLLPEGLTAVKAARRNRLQTSLNASLGSALASIGLTIPIVGTLSLFLGVPLILGLPPESTALLLLTLFVSTLTFATGRTTILQGGVHLVIFGIFILLTAVP
jgi:Ca2+:H+ antiporter